MNLYILSAIKIEQKSVALKQKFDVENIYIDDEIKHINDVQELFENKEEKILAVDPDWCEWSLNAETLNKIEKLQAIFISSTSYDWIDLNYLKQKHIKLFNSPGFSSQAVAEWNMMMTINLARKIPLQIKEGWKQDYERYQGYELQEKTCGVIGLGNIGSAYAKLMKGLGMKVQYWSRFSRNNDYKFVELSELFKTSDVIFIALQANKETEKLITDEMIRSMKPSAIFTTAIKHIYNHKLLLKQVSDGNVWGYGFESEASDFDNYEGNVWAAPALAWCTKESFQRDLEIWFAGIEHFLKGEELNRVV